MADVARIVRPRQALLGRRVGHAEHAFALGNRPLAVQRLPAGRECRRLLDGDPATWFTTRHDKVQIFWEPDSGTYGNRYGLTASERAECAPSSWKLYGSVDNANWVLLAEEVGQRFEPGETKWFYCRENTDYRAYAH